MHRWRTGVVSLLLVVGLTASTAAQSDARNLQGIESFQIVVDNTGSLLSEERIIKAVERQLRSLDLGHTIGDADQWLNIDPDQWLNIRVALVGDERSEISYFVAVEMIEPATVTRTGRSSQAVVWSAQHVAYCKNCRYPERDILAIVEEQIRLFARDYVSANPRY